MKFALATLVVCLSVAYVLADVASFKEQDPNKGKLSERRGHQTQLRPRLGHFKELPFMDLYKHYVAAKIWDKEKNDRELDDYVNYLPSGGECMVFFRKFRINRYELTDVEEIIVLDACLGYLFESQKYHERDMEENSLVRDDLASLQADEKLKELYDNTKINSYSEEAKACVGDLLMRTAFARKEWSEDVCNSNLIQIYVQFAECHKTIENWEENSKSDSYLKIIYGLVKQRGHECFLNEISRLNEAVRAKYVNNPFNHPINKAKGSVLGWFNKASKQKAKRLWPDEIQRLLAAVEGIESNKPVGIREVHQLLRGTSIGDETMTGYLLNNMAVFATNEIAPKAENSQNDPDGSQRYEELINKLCNFFRSSSNPKFYDYATPIIRMLRMLRHEEIFGISTSDFTEAMLAEGFETAPLYLSVFSCNLLTFTYGQIARVPQNAPMKYQVAFQPDLSKMVRWPDAGYY